MLCCIWLYRIWSNDVTWAELSSSSTSPWLSRFLGEKWCIAKLLFLHTQWDILDSMWQLWAIMISIIIINLHCSCIVHDRICSFLPCDVNEIWRRITQKKSVNLLDSRAVTCVNYHQIRWEHINPVIIHTGFEKRHLSNRRDKRNDWTSTHSAIVQKINAKPLLYVRVCVGVLGFGFRLSRHAAVAMQFFIWWPMIRARNPVKLFILSMLFSESIFEYNAINIGGLCGYIIFGFMQCENRIVVVRRRE